MNHITIIEGKDKNDLQAQLDEIYKNQQLVQPIAMGGYRMAISFYTPETGAEKLTQIRSFLKYGNRLPKGEWQQLVSDVLLLCKEIAEDEDWKEWLAINKIQ